jgi:hypothetical protein
MDGIAGIAFLALTFGTFESARGVENQPGISTQGQAAIM